MPRFEYQSDRLYLVEWAAQALTLHAGSEKEAKAIAAEYLQGKMEVQLHIPERIPPDAPR